MTSWLAHRRAGGRGSYWAALSLRGRISLVATALLTGAVITGAVLTLFVVRLSLTRALDSSALRTANDVASLATTGQPPKPLLANNGGVVQVQLVDADNRVVDYSLGADQVVSMLSRSQLQAARNHSTLLVRGLIPGAQEPARVIGVPVGAQTVLVASDAAQIERSVRIIRLAALVGCPIAVVAMALLTYWVVGRTLRTVATLRHGAEDITAAGLAEQRLPVGNAHDEIHNLAVTLNAMLDRIDASTTRQRTFVGDAAHELRSPLASVRVQLEVAARMADSTDWPAVVSDTLVDVDRLDNLVADLLTLARTDEAAGGLRRHEPVELATLVDDVISGYDNAIVEVRYRPEQTAIVDGDVDGLRRVVVNLVDNAVRFAQSAVTVTVQQPDEGGAVELVVADDGPGVPAAERERIFDRFYRTESSRSRESGGTGLGLPIVRDLVRAHGGTIHVEPNQTAPDGTETGLRAVVSFPPRTPSH